MIGPTVHCICLLDESSLKDQNNRNKARIKGEKGKKQSILLMYQRFTWTCTIVSAVFVNIDKCFSNFLKYVLMSQQFSWIDTLKVGSILRKTKRYQIESWNLNFS